MKRLFFTADHDEVDDDVVCVGYFETEDYPAALQMFDRCYDGAELLLEAGQEMAFYLSRHCAELGLKIAAYGSRSEWPEHNLGSLLQALRDRNPEHPAFQDSGEAQELRAMIEDISRHDQSGQAGRYPSLSGGEISFPGLCHVSKPQLERFLGLVLAYFRDPLVEELASDQEA
jgi:hypothetical protein